MYVVHDGRPASWKRMAVREILARGSPALSAADHCRPRAPAPVYLLVWRSRGPVLLLDGLRRREPRALGSGLRHPRGRGAGLLSRSAGDEQRVPAGTLDLALDAPAGHARQIVGEESREDRALRCIGPGEHVA